jgi:hypothetical protein
MESKEITIALTSCGRLDLLEQTIKSLFENWDGPNPKAFLIHEDSKNFGPKEYHLLLDSLNDLTGVFWPKIDLSNIKLGQIKAIDHLYSKVKTPYIFHCEDDWLFHKSGFITQSMDILETNPKIMQVWIRAQNDRNGHPVVGIPRMTGNRTRFQMLSSEYRKEWSGFSFNPGLRRLSDYKNTFPNGYSGVTEFNIKEPWKSEIEVGQVYKKAGFKAATLMQGFVKHLGANRHISS